MQKNKFVHKDIRAVCNSAAKKLMALVLATTVGGASFTGSNLKFVACAQNDSIYEDEPIYEDSQESQQRPQPHLICDDHHTVVVGNGPTTVASTGPTTIMATSSLTVNPGIRMTLRNGTTFEVEATAAETLENLSNAARTSTNGLRHRGGEMSQLVSINDTVGQISAEESGTIVAAGPEENVQMTQQDVNDRVNRACFNGFVCGVAGYLVPAICFIIAIWAPELIPDFSGIVKFPE